MPTLASTDLYRVPSRRSRKSVRAGLPVRPVGTDIGRDVHCNANNDSVGGCHVAPIVTYYLDLNVYIVHVTGLTIEDSSMKAL